MKSKFLQNKTQMMMMLLAFLILLTMQKLVAQPVCTSPSTIMYGLTQKGELRPVIVSTGQVLAKINPDDKGKNAELSNGLGYNTVNGKFYYFKRNGDSNPQEFVCYDPMVDTVKILASCPTTTLVNLGAVAQHGLGYYCIDEFGILYYYRIATNSWITICSAIKNQSGVTLKSIISINTTPKSSDRIYGDLAFDGTGNMWIVISGPDDFGLYKIPKNIPTNAVTTLTMYQIVAPTTPSPGGETIGGIAFNTTGQMLITTNKGDNKIYRMNNNYSLTYVSTMDVDAAGTDFTSCSTPMFVLSTNWLDVSVKPENDNAEIKFTVDASQDNRGYYIEHSTDGKNWEEIAFIADRKAANSTQTYFYSHKSILSGKHQYRISSIDIVGRKMYSDEHVININNGARISLYPNPATSNLQLVLPSENSMNSEVTIFDHAGRQLLSSKLKAGTNSINIQSLMPGAYFVRVALAGGLVINQRFIKNQQ